MAKAKTHKVSETNKMKLLTTCAVVLLYFFLPLITNINTTSVTLTSLLYNLIILGILIFIYRKDLKSNWKGFKSKPKKSIPQVLLFTLIFFVIGVVANIIVSTIIPNFGTTSDSVLQTIAKSSTKGLFFVIFLTVIYYPIAEELVFRKSLREILPNNSLLFIILSSVVTWYFQVAFINPSINEVINAFPYFMFSIFLSIVFVKKDNLWYTIIPRMLYNLIAFIPFFIQ